ncbi:AbrB/MazE/SpoVT family DNA-binding domain-containing protein [Caldalkalibacillus mannanilyticus]|uniref:AbrB/MazE/SpoVT family DNA-binding domain-containing protein n=1 Tax=Caldalkalibacillus mannanilyticus TaxID=1418 RepID=UPI00046988F1|nr:AbrB/MazE/SpoVT family DNA-binding domain-containing protein [Caldalkalibacillus mannanilyticus]
MIVRKTDQLGRIVLPKSTRKHFNIDTGESLEFFIDANNQIVLRKYNPSCSFCDSYEDNLIFKNKNLCRTCVSEIKEIKS